MTLTEFRYIVAVARERHFGRAARACHVSQPTLSVAVRKLEGELGVTLFERGPQDVSVTPVGERIVEQARRVLAETGTLRELAEQAQDPLSGPLRLGAIHTIGPYLFPNLIPTLRESAPRMPLVIEEGFTGRLRERLHAGDLDAVLVALPFEGSGIEVMPLYDEPFRVLVHAEHPWAGQATVDVGELATENVLLLGSGHCFRDQVLEACPDCAPTLAEEPGRDRALEGSSLETIRHMVASGMGVTVLPATAVGADPYRSELLAARPFEPPEPRRRVALAWRRSLPRRPAIDAIAGAVRECGLDGVDFLDALPAA